MVIDEFGNHRFYGTYRGAVFDNKDPLGKNRLRLQIPQVLFKEVTQWCWGQGASALPAVGTGVWVTFEGGDPSFPVWNGTFGTATNSMADLRAVLPATYNPATATIGVDQTAFSNVGTPGTYTKVTTDTYGRVTAGTTLASSDIPTLPESQIINLTTDLAAKAPLVSPSFTTPSLGVATATSVNGTAIPSTSTLVTTTTVLPYTNIQNVSTTNTFLGRKSAGAGVVEELSANNAVVVLNTATSAIAATAGGTGQTTYAIGDVLYAGTSTTVSKLSDVAVGNVLISGGVTTAPSYGKVQLSGATTHITGTLPATNGGTGQATYAVGDLLLGGATNTLVVKSAVATGSALISQGVGVSPTWGVVPLAAGGAGAAVTAAAGGVAYSTASALAISAVGTTGQLLQSAGAGVPVWGYAPSFNAIINGGMDIWQRGTTSVYYNGYGCVDRWSHNATASTTYAQSSALPVAGCQYALRATVGAAAASVQFFQTIETLNVLPLAGNTTAFSAYVATSTSASVRLIVEYSTATDVATTGTWTSLTSTTLSTTAAMSRLVTTSAIPSTARSLRVSVLSDTTLAIGATMSVTGAQLELGSTATPFHRNAPSIQGELAACQRYYWRTTSLATNSPFGFGTAYSTTVAAVPVRLPVSLRVAPTALEQSALSTFVAVDGASSLTPSSISFYGSTGSTDLVLLNVVCASLTAFRPYILWATGTGAYLGFSAEL